MFLSATTLGKMILDAAGLPIKNSKSVRVSCNAGDIAEIEVTYLVEADSAEKIAEAIKRFMLVEMVG